MAQTTLEPRRFFFFLAAVLMLTPLALAARADAQCSATPLPGCLRAGKSSVFVRNVPELRANRLNYLWVKGAATTQADLGDPTASTTYNLCVYDYSSRTAPGLSAALDIPTGGSWTNKSPDGLSYLDRSQVPSGVRRVRIKTGAEGRSRVSLHSRGPELVDPTPATPFQFFAQVPRVVVQLTSSAGTCWTSDFVLSGTKHNDGRRFRARAFPASTTTTIPLTTTTVTTTTSTSTTTTTVPVPGECPNTLDLVIFGNVTNDSCTTNADCPVPPPLGRCDTVLGACRTGTSLETGYTGLAHANDVSDRTLMSLRLLCPGPFDSGSAEPCGECTVLGLDTAAGDCRCNTDSRILCDDGFGLDFDDCGVGASCSTDDDCRVCSQTTSTSCVIDDDCPSGERCLNGLLLPTCSGGQCVGSCDCFAGPPLPLASSSTPACVVSRLAADISGTVNVDTGASLTSMSLRSVVSLGELVVVPCPYCTGDVTPNDGVRDGTCTFGQNDGLSCDSQATNLTFPAPGGDGHSLDCPPQPGKNVSGAGLRVAFSPSTGFAQLDANVECGFPPFAPEMCPCGICGTNSSVVCSSNADCADEGVLGPCRLKAALIPRANQCSDSTCSVATSACIADPSVACTTNGDCAGAGGTCVGVTGVCAAGPTASFCDGALKANGAPIVGCNTNADCDATECGGGIGPGLCGSCSVMADRECFLDPIIAVGKADPDYPFTAALTCIPETSSPGINNVAGLPGPGRLQTQHVATAYCTSDPGTVYVPGVGGCP